MKTLTVIATCCVLLTSLTFGQSKTPLVNSGDLGNGKEASSVPTLLALTRTDATDEIPSLGGGSANLGANTKFRCASEPISNEYSAMCETVRQFSEAMESRNMSQLRQVWPITGKPAKIMQEYFRDFQGVTVKEDCPYEPKITSVGRAQLFCYEVIRATTVAGDFKAVKWQFPVTFMLSKDSGTWLVDYRKVTKRPDGSGGWN